MYKQKDKKKKPINTGIRFLRGLGIILLMILLCALSPILWPVYLGIAVLRPEAVINLLCDTKVF